MIPWPEPSGILLISDGRAAFKWTPSCVTFTSYKRVYYLLMREPARSLGIWHPICAWLLQDPYVGTWFPLYRQVQVLHLCETKKIKQCLVCSVLISYTYKRSWPWIYLPPVDEVFQAFRLKYCVVVLYLFSQSAGRRSKILIIWYLSVDRNSLERAYYVLLLAGKR